MLDDLLAVAGVVDRQMSWICSIVNMGFALIMQTRVPERHRVRRPFDIVVSTGHLTRLGDREWRQQLDRHDAMVREKLEAFRGREVDTAGDEAMLPTASQPASRRPWASSSPRSKTMRCSGEPAAAWRQARSFRHRGTISARRSILRRASRENVDSGRSPVTPRRRLPSGAARRSVRDGSAGSRIHAQSCRFVVRETNQASSLLTEPPPSAIPTRAAPRGAHRTRAPNVQSISRSDPHGSAFTCAQWRPERAIFAPGVVPSSQSLQAQIRDLRWQHRWRLARSAAKQSPRARSAAPMRRTTSLPGLTNRMIVLAFEPGIRLDLEVDRQTVSEDRQTVSEGRRRDWGLREEEACDYHARIEHPGRAGSYIACGRGQASPRERV
jgi:hypothetical protein